MKWNKKKTSVLIDKFLFDVVIYKLRRKKEYITNKGNLKKKGPAKKNYQELMRKSDNNLMSNFLSNAVHFKWQAHTVFHLALCCTQSRDRPIAGDMQQSS